MKHAWLRLLGALLATGSAFAAEEKMDVLEIRVLGNTRLPALAIEQAVYPYTGPGRKMEDLESARQTLEAAYRIAGFSTVYVDIPEQSVDEGVVRLRVTEGKLARVRVEGAKYFSARAIRAALPAATADEVPNIPELQRNLAALNAETPDRSITPVLAAGPRPGTVDLTLKVDDHLPVRASVEINDQYTADTSRWRASASLGYDNLFDRLDSISLQYQTAPEDTDQTQVLAGTYVTRWGRDDRNRFVLTYIDSNSNVAAVGTLNVIGAGKIANAQLLFPLMNEANASHSLSFGAAFKDFNDEIRLSDDSLQTPISYLGFSLGESSVWRTEHGEWTLNSSANFGVRGWQNSPGEFADKRYRARPNYFYLRADASRRQILGRWFEARARVGGQYAVEPIISNEQFAIGGATSVRGYLEAAELGDIGVSGSLEFGIQPRRFAGDHVVVEGFAFYDAGIASSIAPLPGEDRRVDLSSVGLAFNLGLYDHYAASISWAYPLVPSGRTDAGDSRFLFMMRSSW